MYCNNCGAVVVGKFCSCCGKRVLNSLEEFRRVERQTYKEYQNQFKCYYKDKFDLMVDHLATACWYACDHKYGNNKVVGSFRNGFTVSPDAYTKLATVKEHATKLFERLWAADDF